MKIKRERLWIMAWFTFTRRERNGILVLSFILFLLQCTLLYRYFVMPDVSPVKLKPEEKRMVNDLLARKEHAKVFTPKTSVKITINGPVDPDTFSQKTWVALGLSPKQAAVIASWKAKGGVFRKKEDVAGMKFIPASVYEKIEPWLVFNNHAVAPAKPAVTYTKPDIKLLDLNTADTVSLCDLPLIGPGRARTIVRFREKLGGYYSIEQLKEIRSIPDSVFQVIRNRLEIGAGVYRKIDVNAVTDTLYHPYFSKNLLRMMMAFRRQNGPFRTETDLRKLPLVDEDLWRKIAPYIILSPLK